MVSFLSQLDLQIIMAFYLVKNGDNLVQGCQIRQFGFQLKDFYVELANQQIGPLHVVVQVCVVFLNLVHGILI